MPFLSSQAAHLSHGFCDVELKPKGAGNVAKMGFPDMISIVGTLVANGIPSVKPLSALVTLETLEGNMSD